MQKQIAQLRNLDLKLILIHFQAVQDQRDPERWQTSKGPISVTGPKFMNWKLAVGGGGAIDLVMHLLNCDCNTAIAWLAHHFPCPPPYQTPSISSPRNPMLALPPRNDQKLPQIISYLHSQRRIPLNIIFALIDSQKIYADHRGNAVFPLTGKGNKIVGAEIRGTTITPWHGMAKGSRKDLGCFFIKSPDARMALICESAIDAISFFTMTPHWTAISTSGAHPYPAWLPLLIAKGYSVHCGYDADVTGDSMAAKMITRYPAIKRLRPALHDWNDILVRT